MIFSWNNLPNHTQSFWFPVSDSMKKQTMNAVVPSSTQHVWINKIHAKSLWSVIITMMCCIMSNLHLVQILSSSKYYETVVAQVSPGACVNQLALRFSSFSVIIIWLGMKNFVEEILVLEESTFQHILCWTEIFFSDTSTRTTCPNLIN